MDHVPRLLMLKYCVGMMKVVVSYILIKKDMVGMQAIRAS